MSIIGLCNSTRERAQWLLIFMKRDVIDERRAASLRFFIRSHRGELKINAGARGILGSMGGK